MTKEQYIKMRQNGDFNTVYEYYKEKFDHSKHRPFLGIQDVANLLLNLGYNIDRVMNTCLEHYDQQFSIVKISDKDGNLIGLS
jgi:hypothetical protein